MQPSCAIPPFRARAVRVMPAALQQARAASYRDVQGALRRFFAETQAAMEDLFPDDAACGPGSTGGIAGTSGGGGGLDSGAGMRDGGGGGTGGTGAGSRVDSGDQGEAAAGARSHWRVPRRRLGESDADAAARVAAGGGGGGGRGGVLLFLWCVGGGGGGGAPLAPPPPPPAALFKAAC
jgi:hypothetical protein